MRDKKEYSVLMVFDLKKIVADEEIAPQKIPLMIKEWSPPPEDALKRKRFLSSGGTPFQYIRANELKASFDLAFCQMVASRSHTHT